MNMRYGIKKIWESWCEKYLTSTQARSKSTLQCAIEQELAHLKQENTPLTGAVRSSIFQR